MTKWLCRKFALSEQGAKNLEKGIFWSVFAYLSLILPMGVFLQFLFEVLISRLIQGKTVLIIAHRMRTVADADQIIVLDRGVVTQKGTPDELMKQDGIYRMMVQLQQNSEAWSVK